MEGEVFPPWCWRRRRERREKDVVARASSRSQIKISVSCSWFGRVPVVTSVFPSSLGGVGGDLWPFLPVRRGGWLEEENGVGFKINKLGVLLRTGIESVCVRGLEFEGMSENWKLVSFWIEPLYKCNVRCLKNIFLKIVDDYTIVFFFPWKYKIKCSSVLGIKADFFKASCSFYES